MLAPRLLLLVAILASLAVLGCWDNQRQIQRVMEQGYETMAEITGARYQRGLPLTIDGWRPRFVEQDLSVNLKWAGRDGATREHEGVPVTETLSRNFVSGEQVRLVSLPIKALDDGTPPVIRSDVNARLASLHRWLTVAGYIALASWAGFAGLTVWLRRQAAAKAVGGRGDGAAAVTMQAPLRRTILGIVLLFGGAFAAFYAWSDARSGEAARSRGVEAAAQLLDAGTRSQDGRTVYTVRLSWKDPQGAVHHFGPAPVSEAYWRRITRDGELIERQTTIRYQPDEAMARPVILDDLPEPGWQGRYGIGAGIVVMLLGAGLLFSAMRHMRRAGG